MKRRKSYSAEIMLLSGLLILGIGTYALAAQASGKTELPPKETADPVCGSGNTVSLEGVTDEDAEQVYLYRDGMDGYTEVEETREPQSDWEQLKDGTSEEVYLSFSRTEGNTYQYRDEDGRLFATLTIKEEPSQIIPREKKRYGVDWSLEEGTYSCGTANLSLSDVYKLHIYLAASDAQKTYAGLYSAELDRYIWMELPIVSLHGRDYTLSLSASGTYQFALKNGDETADRYIGRYDITAGA